MNTRSRYIRLAAPLLALAALVWPAFADITQQAYLKENIPGVDHYFGEWVAISGDTAVVGSAMGGAVIFVRSGADWIQQANLKAGGSVAISGDTVIVGDELDSSNATGVNGDPSNNGAPGSGAAYVFVRQGTNWIQQAYLKASNTDTGDRFGYSVTISGDTIVVGAVFEGSNATGVNGDQEDNSAQYSGAAYVFVRNGTNWTQQAYLKASNTDADDKFGFSVAISGETVVVGAYEESSNATGVNGDQSDNSAQSAGAAYVFVRNGTNWTQQGYLKASNTDAGDSFGDVAVSGNTVVVGASGEQSSATGVNGDQSDNSLGAVGAAYVFVRNGTIWTQQAYLKASNTGNGDYFGEPVAISGDTIVVGAVQEDSNAIGIDGDQTDNSAQNSGAAYVFVRNGTNWTQQAYIKASNTDAYDYFGSVAISGDTVVVGGMLEDSNASGVNGDQTDNSLKNAGAAYVFTGLGNVLPQLTIVASASSVQISWPINATGFVLQSATTLANGGDWQDSSLTPLQEVAQWVVTVPVENGAHFFRLQKP